MLDLDVRSVYGRLQSIATLAGAGGAERRASLEAILTEGYTLSCIVEQLVSRTMASQEQLVSLFYSMGMLTIGQKPPGSAVPRLEIPTG